MERVERSADKVAMFQESMQLYNEGQLIQCADVALQALRVAQDDGDHEMAMRLHGGLTECLRKMGRYACALEHAQMQQQIAEKLNLHLGQAQAKNGIALSLTELGDLEGSRRYLDEALQHCRSVEPAGRLVVQQQLALFLCTTLANLAEHSVNVGQWKDAVGFVHQLQDTDMGCLDQKLWSARAASILESIHRHFGTEAPLDEEEVANLAECRELGRSSSSETLQALADEAHAGGNTTRMCQVLLSRPSLPSLSQPFCLSTFPPHYLALAHSCTLSASPLRSLTLHACPPIPSTTLTTPPLTLRFRARFFNRLPVRTC